MHAAACKPHLNNNEPDYNPFQVGAVFGVSVVAQHVQHLLQHLRAAHGSAPAVCCRRAASRCQPRCMAMKIAENKRDFF